MKHVTYANKSFLIGDEAAELLVTYTAALASAKLGDSVKLHAIGSDGDDEEIQLLLDTGAPLLAESASSSLPEPDNSAAIEHMRESMRSLLTSPATESIDDLSQEQIERTARDIEYL
ncbi:hypothetical protein [Naasia sp. SYSU D00948]|uniref:hypothetical protein n=1 Tax=Naasia sp. SYSU D00948 TaxID=2817379 RepID=UPI001B30B34C|nr:hypothetical protein [Naasia sp. SYSU D00948]